MQQLEGLPPVMTSQPERELCFVTWNTQGIKETNNFQHKCLQWERTLNTLKADIAFLQETHVGLKDCDIYKWITKSWKVYFTVYSSRSKGVAILIRDDKDFEYICHDEDHSGRYIVLFCRLYGELYTLVNVYNHKADKNVLYTLKDYLQETAEGVLVVGGDFNTVLEPGIDRSPSVGREDPLRGILEDFSESLNLRDTWAHLHPTDRDFTRCQNDSYSRLDMFFVPEDIMRRVHRCEIEGKKISDHDPVVLTLRVQERSETKKPKVAQNLKECGERKIRLGKISGAEILSAIKSLTDSGEEKPDKFTIRYYKENRCQLTEVLKIEYNNILKDKQIASDFRECRYVEGRCIFNVKYLTFVLILARRLNVFLTPPFEQKKKKIKKKSELNICVMVTFAQVPKKIKKTFLEQSLKGLKTTLKSLKKRFPPATSLTLFQSAPPPDFSILANLLPEDKEFTCLQEGCPLTRPILNLALKQLQYDLIRTGCMTSFCQIRQIIVVYAETPDTSQKADNSDTSMETSQEADILEEAEPDAFQKVDTSESDMSEETFEEADSSAETDTSMKDQEFLDEFEELFEEEGFSEDDAETDITEEAHTFMQSSQESDAFEEAESDTSQKADTSEKENMLQKVWKLVEQFQEDSGIKLNVYPPYRE
ncbi:uncharacterized protein LOC108429913 [Pygocentrus nattereri]|uniref:exodeoxyribonuclease III n=1 Tax=Pygocentrus nattereri TaxID=42514 RepID=A0A3B4DD31_PYGNA|nr:uncharacterized protein LOC108429913 [Pygocentrus nattereri]